MNNKFDDDSFLRHAETLSDSEIIDNLDSLGVQVTKKAFRQWDRDHYSLSEFTQQLLKETGIREDTETYAKIKTYLGLLWGKWFPKSVIIEKLDRRVGSAYKLMRGKDYTDSADLFLESWKELLMLMKRLNIDSIDKFDHEITLGTEMVCNMVSDIEEVLLWAGRTDSKYYDERIAFCNEYVDRFSKESSLTTENMKRAAAETYAIKGDLNEAEKLFQKHLRKDPEWGWGWIGWSDCHWLINKGISDLEKAEDILKKGLQVTNIRDRKDLLYRLEEIHIEAGEFDKAREVHNEIDREAGLPEDTPTLSDREAFVQRKADKIGRNSPCPCGSGKKYKYCCGGTL